MQQLEVRAHFFPNSGHRSCRMPAQLAISPANRDSESVFVEKIASTRFALAADGQSVYVNGIEIIPVDRDSAQALAQAFNGGKQENRIFDEYYRRATDGSPVCVFH